MTVSRAKIIKYLRGIVAVVVACALDRWGDQALGVTMELYHGLSGFGMPLLLDMFVLPFFLGMLVTFIFGEGGKWLSHFPPLFVRLYSYYEIVYVTGIPEGSALIPMGLWVFFVILAMEFSAAGGVVGEVVIKSIYGRSPRHKIYKDRDADDDE
ncbi:MAG: hypothetical protein LBE50_04235 [Gallionellaceae bacterium]|jgi:hypothetical protein|nr:hypothetical protein [Gallionellaceae bacterium]